MIAILLGRAAPGFVPEIPAHAGNDRASIQGVADQRIHVGAVFVRQLRQWAAEIVVTACNHPRTGSHSSAGPAHARCNWRKVSGSRSLRLGSIAIATGSQS